MIGPYLGLPLGPADAGHQVDGGQGLREVNWEVRRLGDHRGQAVGPAQRLFEQHGQFTAPVAQTPKKESTIVFS